MLRISRNLLVACAVTLGAALMAPAAQAQGWHDGYFSGGFSPRYDVYGPYGHLTHPRATPNFDYRGLGPRYFRARPNFRQSQLDLVPYPYYYGPSWH